LFGAVVSALPTGHATGWLVPAGATVALSQAPAMTTRPAPIDPGVEADAFANRPALSMAGSLTPADPPHGLRAASIGGSLDADPRQTTDKTLLRLRPLFSALDASAHKMPNAKLTDDEERANDVRIGTPG
jgi:hypothetical protein